MTGQAWQTGEVRYSGRDRSGRVPSASRSDTFYQSISDWNTSGPTRPLEPAAPEPHTQDYSDDDIVRGNGR